MIAVERTAESVNLSATEARDLTDRIKTVVGAAWELVKQAYQQRAWVALGYTSWDAYCSAEFGASRLRLPREERQEVVASLRESGLSQRAIGAAIGVDQRTVGADLTQRREEDSSPEPIDPERRGLAGRPRPADREPLPKVQGTDGKSYPASPQHPSSKPRRAPLPAQAMRAAWQFRKAFERLERIMDDDRVPANRAAIAAQLGGHLAYVHDEIANMLIDLRS